MQVPNGLFSYERTDIHQLRDFLLNQRRMSGWTQEELSERSGVSVRTIRNLETGANTNPRRTSVTLLLTALGAAPAALAETAPWDGPGWPVLPGQRKESASAQPATPWYGPRPLGDPLVGRHSDLRHVLAAAQRSRLIVLTGPGGVGKTRLALAAAARLRLLFSGGVAVAELSDIPPEHLDPRRSREELTRVAQKLVGADGVLGGGGRLLVLDGAEHVAQQAARTARQLLDVHPGLHVLVTSRRALAAGAAETWEVQPLSTEMGEGREAELPSAVELLLRRVQAGLPTLDLGGRLPMVGRLCRLLDGVPLAIEVAAQRLRSLPIGSLLQEETLFHLLDQVDTGGLSQHRTLTDSVRWSYDLLPEAHRELLRALVVLPDGFTLEHALGMQPERLAEPTRIARLLAELVDSSLVQTDREQQYRYRVHRLVRHVVAQAEQADPPLSPAELRDHRWSASAADVLPYAV